ncbi:MAG: flavin reductase family protein [Actinobacteria bacterium]|nr:flavin reductase family protein [Actinomycetota bacterium]
MSTDFTPRQALGVIDSPVVLLTSAADGMRNVMTVNMVMGVSFNPVLVAISLNPGSFSHELIERSGDFAINVAGPDQISLVERVGSAHGAEVDKFDDFGIVTKAAERVVAPLVDGCPAALECRVIDTHPAGEHTVFIGHVVALHRREGLPIFLYRGDYYEPGNKLGTFFKGEAA